MVFVVRPGCTESFSTRYAMKELSCFWIAKAPYKRESPQMTPELVAGIKVSLAFQYQNQAPSAGLDQGRRCSFSLEEKVTWPLVAAEVPNPKTLFRNRKLSGTLSSVGTLSTVW